MTSTIPDVTRVAWTSDSVRENWHPRFRRISTAWHAICCQSVTAGLRPAFMTSIRIEEFVRRSAMWCRQGLASVPLGLEGAARSIYSARSRPPQRGESPDVRVGVGSIETLARLSRANEAGDHETIGALLGYPACCRASFQQVWVARKGVDPTWPMALHTVGSDSHDAATLVEVTGAPAANVLWRWLGIRAVPHLPCSFTCAASEALGRAFLALGDDMGYTVEMSWMRDILQWPVEWSALHGIAEIKTPILKVSTTTDLLSGKRIVRWRGSTYPTDGARGLAFPFEAPRRRFVTDSLDFRRGMSQPLPRPAGNEENDWLQLDNGFSAREAMDAAHAPIVAMAKAVLKSGDRILDLGCGNGALLSRICAATPGLTPFGVDRRAEVVEHVRTVLPAFVDNFQVGDLFDVTHWEKDPPYRLVLLMVGRLFEVSQGRRDNVIEGLRRSSQTVLLYRYPGTWSEDFRATVEKAGLGNVIALTGQCALVTLPRH